MDHKIEIVGVDTLPVHRQLFRVVFKPHMNLVTVLFCLAALSMWLIGWAEADLARQITAVLYLLCAVVMRQIPKWAANRAYRDRVKYYNGQIPETTARFGDKLELEDVDSSSAIPYDKISRVHFTEDAIVILVAKQKAIGIPNQTFTKGTLPELKQFLRENCLNAKISE